MILPRILFASIAIPFVLANTGGESGYSGCSDFEFKWDAKNCCLPYGGPFPHESPPKGSQCPSNWSWKSDKGCCAPHQPPQNLPPPQCNNGWRWSDTTYSCWPPSEPSTTTSHHHHHHHPSATPTPPSNGESDDDKGYHHDKRGMANQKRQHRSRSVSLCPQDLTACVVSSLTGSDFECVDTFSDLDNCGGCAISGAGQNCNAITGAWNVGCENGVCKIYTCAQGYKPGRDSTSCIPL